MKISVVIPTKDDEKIFKAIEEVKEQNPYEIIVVNDSESSENYKRKLKELEGIKYLEVEGGLAKARNRGAERAEGEKILFLDSDCYPTENWKKKMSKALEESDIVEGEVEYIGERCPFSRIVENRGEEGRFLTANLGVRKDVFEDIKFDEDYEIFREDTDFGLRALEKGYTSSFVEAKVEHDAGRRTSAKFIEDQLRYDTEPYFYKKFKNNEKLGDHLSSLGPILYPEELFFTAVILLGLAASFFKPEIILGPLMAAVFLTTYYTASSMKQKDASFSPKDWIQGLYIIPIGMVAKRYAIWKGGFKHRILVV
ncbi:MAG: glycosyltransferase family 2 protein [Candidatus Nanohaloarchaeota archaeon QJJ-9]|nr:glycosyltransferase family 2 protein [Candidatus Nanohaloarchaeota archaeon QJJ-9]